MDKHVRRLYFLIILYNYIYIRCIVSVFLEYVNLLTFSRMPVYELYVTNYLIIYVSVLFTLFFADCFLISLVFGGRFYRFLFILYLQSGD